MLSPSEAEAAIRSSVPVLPVETRALPQLCGAVLREPIRATRDQPPFHRVTMDGIALSSEAFTNGRREFRIAGTQGAGSAPLELENADECIEVMTGAMLPRGCDCVVPVEKISTHGGVARLTEDVAAAPMLNVHPRGLDCREGDLLLEPGIRLGPPEVAVIASAGLTSARVSREPSIVVISTGDELVEPGQAVTDWQIHRSNVFGVCAALQRHGFSRLSQDHLPDDLELLRTRLRAHLDTHDVLVLSGGVSMGRFDFIPQVLGELGVKIVFHKIAQRPGKPMWFGIAPGGQAVYALPGNPVSTLVCLTRYVFAGLDAAAAAAPRPVESTHLTREFDVKPPMTFFLPVKIAPGAAGAAPAPTKGSGDFTSLIGTDGFVELPPGPQVIPCGTPVPLYRW
jgi:molybdopterin molybdotransferase